MDAEPQGLNDFVSQPDTVQPNMPQNMPEPAGLDDIVNDYQNEQKYGPSVANALKTGLLGAGEGLTFNLSNMALTKSGLMTPDEINQLEQRNKIAHGIGVAGGIGLGLLGPTEIGAGVQGVSKVGEGVSLAAKALGMSSELGLKTLGLATEGAFYGAGNSVNESVLGDPDLAAEHLMSNIGYGMLWGGAGGAAFGLLGKAADSAGGKITDIINDIKTRTATAVPEGAEALASVLPTARQSVLDGLSQKIPEASDIKEVADANGLAEFPGMYSSNKITRGALSTLLQSRTVVGDRMAQAAEDEIQKAKNIVTGMVKTDAPESVIQLGANLKSSTLPTFESEYAKTKSLYDMIHQQSDHIPVSEASVNRLADNILSIKGLVDSEGNPISASSPQWKLASETANEIRGKKTVEDLMDYHQALAAKTSGPVDRFTKSIGAAIHDNLTNLEENTMENFAKKNFTPDSEYGKQILDAVDAMPQARASYAELRGKFDPILEMTGKKASGPADFIAKLSDTDEQKIGQSILNKSNTNTFQEFAENFPEQAKMITDFKKNQLLAGAQDKNGLNISKLYKNIIDEKKTPTELRKLMFSDDDLNTINRIAQWKDKIPFREVGPSGTPAGSEAIRLFSTPVKWLTNNARDYGLKRSLEGLDGSKAGVLAEIEKNIVKNTNTIYSGVKQIFSGGAQPVQRGILGAAIYDDHDKFQKFNNRLSELSNPSVLVNEANRITSPLHDAAPNISGGIGETIVRALSTIHQAMPKMPKDPMSDAYEPSLTEKAHFQRVLAAVENPIGILNHVSRGTLTPEELQTVQSVNPKIYDQMKNELMEQLAKKKPEELKNMPFATKQSISMFTGQPMDSSLLPQNVMNFQCSYAMAAQRSQNTQQNKPKIRSSVKLSMGDRMSLQPKD